MRLINLQTNGKEFQVWIKEQLNKLTPEVISCNTKDVKAFGAVGDGITDDTHLKMQLHMLKPKDVC